MIVQDLIFALRKPEKFDVSHCKLQGLGILMQSRPDQSPLDCVLYCA